MHRHQFEESIPTPFSLWTEIPPPFSDDSEVKYAGDIARFLMGSKLE
jgi:hypothetical protein